MLSPSWNCFPNVFGKNHSTNSPSAIFIGYRVLAASPGSSAPLVELIANTNSVAATWRVAGLAGNTDYVFQVQGVNSVGRGDSSPSSTVVRTGPTNLPQVGPSPISGRFLYRKVQGVHF